MMLAEILVFHPWINHQSLSSSSRARPKVTIGGLPLILGLERWQPQTLIKCRIGVTWRVLLMHWHLHLTLVLEMLLALVAIWW